MEASLVNDLLTPASQIAIIIAISEVLKNAGLSPKYIPLVDLALGLMSGIFVYWGQYTFTQRVIIGLGYGLSACGAFSGFKNLTKGG